MSPRAHNRGRTMAGTDRSKMNDSAERSFSPYISPRELARRWRCGRSTVDRIAERERLTRLCLGQGRNGVIRYRLAEVEALEERLLLPG